TALGEEDFVSDSGVINPSILPILRKASQDENISEQGVWAFRGIRGDMTAEVALHFKGPEYQPPDRPFEDYPIRILVTLIDIGGIRLRLEEDCRTSLPPENRRCMRLRAGTWPNPMPVEPPYPPYEHPDWDTDCDGVDDLFEHDDDIAVGAC
ncbi:MAG: hypothetical protein AAGL49_14295, partial [Pseudomonadota bacterium]